MTEDEIKETIKMLEDTRTELEETYPQHFITLTEVGAPQEAFEMLEREQVLLKNKINQAIKNAEFMLATM